MTFRELTQLAGHNPWFLIGFFAAIPLLVYLFGLLHGKGKGAQSPWRYLYAGLIYITCFCGIFSGLLTAYTVFFTNESLLDADVLVFLLPIGSMGATLLLIRKNVRFDDIPGFGRLSGLMVLIGITFALALAIQKTRIWLFFGSSFFTLIIGVAILFGIVKWAASLAFGSSRQNRA